MKQFFLELRPSKEEVTRFLIAVFISLALTETAKRHLVAV
jgi:hypothetical protein